MINNPYIDIIKDHPKIETDLEKIYSTAWKWNEFFWNENDIILEIWTWLWNFFSEEVNNNLDKNFVWMEIKYKRLYKTAEKALRNICNYALNKCELNKVKQENDNFILLKDYWEKVAKIFKKEEISKTYIFFPDPWWKKDRQKKHRLLQTKFLNDLFDVTKIWWEVIFKTDHREYFEFAIEEIKKTKWEIKKQTFDYEKDKLLIEREKITEFESKFRGEGKTVCYAELKK